MKRKLSSVFGSNYLKSNKNENGIDWILFLATLPLLGAGLVTMNSFNTDAAFFSGFFAKQLVWIAISLCIFFIFSFIDFRFLRKTWVSVVLFLSSCGLLLTLFAIGKVAKGALSWFDLGLFSVQPSDPIKLVIIIILAKYFSRRHIEI